MARFLKKATRDRFSSRVQSSFKISSMLTPIVGLPRTVFSVGMEVCMLACIAAAVAATATAIVGVTRGSRIRPRPQSSD